MYHIGHYVYEHRSPDGRLIYVGIGQGPRAYELKGRDGYHQSIIGTYTHDYVDIIAHGITRHEALLMERKIIREEDPPCNIQERIK